MKLGKVLLNKAIASRRQRAWKDNLKAMPFILTALAYQMRQKSIASQHYLRLRREGEAAEMDRVIELV